MAKEEWKVGWYVDYLDIAARNWSVVRILELNTAKDEITFEFEGWNAKWNTTCRLSSRKLAPFRANSVGYTGMKETACRNWILKPSEVQENEEYLNSLIRGSLSTGVAAETTQYLRGKLFTFVDNLLVSPYKKNEQMKSVGFFCVVINYIIEWMKKSKELFPYYYDGVANPDSFLTNDNVALAMAWPELFITLKRIFGFDPRTSRFHKSIQISLKDYEPFFGTVFKTSIYQASSFFVNYFGKLGGFEVLVHILSQKDEKQRIPFEVLKEIPVFDLGPYFEKKFVDQFLAGFKDLILQRIDMITLKELKEFNKEHTNDVLVRLKKLLTDCYKKPDLEVLEKADLSLMLKCFRSPYMEKRLRGLNEIKDAIERTAKSAWYKDTIWITSKYLADWIISEEIVQQIFTYSHAEMIKRVSDILVFLYKNNALTPEHLELLWSSTIGKHDSLVVETHKTIMDISEHLKLDMLMLLYNKMKQVQVTDYDEKFLKMVKDFTIRVLDVSFRDRSTLEDIGLEIFIPLIEDRCIVNYCDLAVDNISHILKHPSFKQKVFKYLQLCLGNITQSNSVPQSLKLLMLILDSKNPNSIFEEQLNKLNESSGGLLNLIINDLEKYMQKSRGGEILEGRYSHEQNLKIRLKTISFFMSSKVISVDFSSFARLWKIFIDSYKADSEFFFKWLEKTSKGPISKELIVEIFEKLFCIDLEIILLSPSAFECFKNQMLLVNNHEKKIDLKAVMSFTRVSERLIGEKTLYKIVINTQNSEIFQSATTFLVTLVQKLSKSTMNFRQNIWQEFVDTLVDQLNANKGNTDIIAKVLKVFQNFLEENCCISASTSNFSKCFYYKGPHDKEYSKIMTNGGDTVRSIRKTIAERYKKPFNEVALRINNTTYDSSNDNIPISLLNTASTISVEFITQRIDLASPKDFLSKHQALQDLLFDLLSEPDKPYCTEAWTLLTSLPTNIRIKSALEYLEADIHKIIDQNSLYKLLYCLVIVTELIKDHDWVAKFKEKRGIEYVLALFKERDVFLLSPSTCMKYSTVMIVLIEEFFNFSIEVDVKFVFRLFDCLSMIGKLCQDPENEEIAAIARSAKNIFSEIIRNNKQTAVEAVGTYTNLKELIEFSMIRCVNKYYPNSIMNLFLEITMNSPTLHNFLCKTLLELLKTAANSSKNTTYWSLLSHIIKENQQEMSISKNIRQIKALLDLHPGETSSKEKDTVLWGLLTVIKISIDKRLMGVKTKFLLYIMNDCLFETSTNPEINRPKCKSDENRKLAFEILESACQVRDTAAGMIISNLSKFHEDPHWRTSNYSDWNYSPIADEKSITGFVGLKNLGNICYMNSTLQQLFNNHSFRNQILSIKDLDANPDDSILHALQFIFTGLKCSAKQYISPKKLCSTFKDWEGKVINVLEQMDADEFFNNLMDKLENQLKTVENKDCIKNHFGGIQTTECIGQGSCTHKSERNENFLTLPVQVKNKKSLQESLESFVEGETLEGDNAYQCDYCETKVTALRRVCIKHLPNNLIIVLRRFEFDFDTMNRVKVNDYCEFPREIDMEPYTQEGLERKELIREQSRSENSVKEQIGKKFPEDYYKFSLKGITIHTGTAESGHYYSYIQDLKTSNWFEFNDIFVSSFDPEDIPSEAFGGVERWNSFYSSNYVSTNREKYRNAYLLFYERDHKYAPRDKDDDQLQDLKSSLQETDSIKFSEVIEENERFWRGKSTFSVEYFTFVTRLLKFETPQIIKFACAFFLVILIRSKEIGKISELYLSLEGSLRKVREVNDWVAEVICVRPVLKELIIDCPVPEKRKIIVGVFAAAFEGLGEETARNVFSSLFGKFRLAVYSKNCASYFELLFLLAKNNVKACSGCSPEETILAYLKGESIDIECIENFTHDDIFFGYKDINAQSDKEIQNTAEDVIKSAPYLPSLLALFTDSFTATTTKKLFEKDLMTLLVYSTHKITNKYIGQMYAKLCTGSKDRFREYVSFLLTGLRENDFDKARIFFRLLTFLIKLEDESSSERLEFIMRGLTDCFKDNKNYIKLTEVSIDYLFKLAGRIPAVKDWLTSRNKEIRWIETYLKESSYQIRQGYSISKKNTPTYVQFAQGPKTNMDRLELYKKFSKGQIADQSAEWDSDDELPIEKLRSGKIDFYDSMINRWVRSSIINNLAGLLCVRPENSTDKSQKWIEVTSDLLAVEGTKASRMGRL